MNIMKKQGGGLMKKPGASLLLVGVLSFFLVSPIVAKLPLIGGVVSPIAWIIGLLGMIGGGYLIARSTLGTGN